MGTQKEEKSYYEQTLVKLIEKYKLMVEQCLTIVGQDIDEDLKDDKLYNALRAKRQAAEDSKWAAKEIDSLQRELNGEDEVEEKKEAKRTNYAEQHAN